MKTTARREMETTLKRVNELIDMDDDIRGLNDEELVSHWLQDGIPDEAINQGDLDMLISIGSDIDAFDEMRDLYDDLMSQDY